MPQPLTKKQLQEWSQRNGEAFNGLMDINGLLPVSGDIQSGLLAANDVAKGNYGSAALNGLGLLPFVPSMAGMFIGKGSKLWDVLKADEAAKLAKAGLSPEEIWPKTGTFQGAEGAWRQEIPDNAAEPIMFGRSSYDIWKDMSKNDNSIRNIQDFINKHPTSPLTAEANKGTTVTAAYDNLPVDNPAQAKPISDFLSHDLLYSSYPDLANIKAGQEKGLDSLVNSGNASFSPDSNFIKYSKISSPEQFKSTTLHELQHAIQEREGWARGGSPEMFKSSTVDGLHSYDDMLHAEQIINMAKQYGKSVNEFMKNPPRWVTEKQVELAKIFENKSAKDLQYAKNYILEKTDPHTAYLNLAGEAEARATQARMNMTMPERLNTFPFDSYDVPKEQLIVRGLLGSQK